MERRTTKSTKAVETVGADGERPGSPLSPRLFSKDGPKEENAALSGDFEKRSKNREE